MYVGNDWAEDHHDVEVLDAAGKRLGRARLPEGVAGISRFHALIGQFADPNDPTGAGQVLVGIETDRGPWVAALVAAGYRLFAVNPAQAARFRERHAISGARSDTGDAHVLADMVRTDAHQLREVAGDSALGEGVKLLARAHQSLIWERTRHLLRLRAGLVEYFPGVLAALAAGGLDLGDRDALELLATAPDPDTAAGLPAEQITDLLSRGARRGDLPARAEAITAALGAPQLTQPPVLAGAYAIVTRSLVAVLTSLAEQVTVSSTGFGGGWVVNRRRFAERPGRCGGGPRTRRVGRGRARRAGGGGCTSRCTRPRRSPGRRCPATALCSAQVLL